MQRKNLLMASTAVALFLGGAAISPALAADVEIVDGAAVPAFTSADDLINKVGVGDTASIDLTAQANRAANSIDTDQDLTLNLNGADSATDVLTIGKYVDIAIGKTLTLGLDEAKLIVTETLAQGGAAGAGRGGSVVVNTGAAAGAGDTASSAEIKGKTHLNSLQIIAGSNAAANPGKAITFTFGVAANNKAPEATEATPNPVVPTTFDVSQFVLTGGDAANGGVAGKATATVNGAASTKEISVRAGAAINNAAAVAGAAEATFEGPVSIGNAGAAGAAGLNVIASDGVGAGAGADATVTFKKDVTFLTGNAVVTAGGSAAAGAGGAAKVTFGGDVIGAAAGTTLTLTTGAKNGAGATGNAEALFKGDVGFSTITLTQDAAAGADIGLASLEFSGTEAQVVSSQIDVTTGGQGEILVSNAKGVTFKKVIGQANALVIKGQEVVANPAKKIQGVAAVNADASATFQANVAAPVVLGVADGKGTYTAIFDTSTQTGIDKLAATGAITALGIVPVPGGNKADYAENNIVVKGGRAFELGVNLGAGIESIVVEGKGTVFSKAAGVTSDGVAQITVREGAVFRQNDVALASVPGGGIALEEGASFVSTAAQAGNLGAGLVAYAAGGGSVDAKITGAGTIDIGIATTFTKAVEAKAANVAAGVTWTINSIGIPALAAQNALDVDTITLAGAASKLALNGHQRTVTGNIVAKTAKEGIVEVADGAVTTTFAGNVGTEASKLLSFGATAGANANKFDMKGDLHAVTITLDDKDVLQFTGTAEGGQTVSGKIEAETANDGAIIVGSAAAGAEASTVTFKGTVGETNKIGTITVNKGSSATFAEAVDANGALKANDGATLTFSKAVATDAAITSTKGGTINFGGAVTSGGGITNVEGGTLKFGDGAVAAGGAIANGKDATLAFGKGAIAGAAGITNAEGGTLTFGGGAVAVGGAIANGSNDKAATMAFTGAGAVTGVTTITNNKNAELTFAGAVTATGAITNNEGATLTTGAGLVKSVGAITNKAGATLTVGAGGLETSDGGISNAKGATINVLAKGRLETKDQTAADATIANAEATMDIGADGTVKTLGAFNNAGGTLTNAGALDAGGAFTNTGGTLTATGDGSVKVGSFTNVADADKDISAGSLSIGAGALTVTGAFTNTGGTLNVGAGTAAAKIGGALENTGGTLSVGAGRTLAVTGKTTNTGATVNIAAGGTLESGTYAASVEGKPTKITLGIKRDADATSVGQIVAKTADTAIDLEHDTIAINVEADSLALTSGVAGAVITGTAEGKAPKAAITDNLFLYDFSLAADADDANVINLVVARNPASRVPASSFGGTIDALLGDALAASDSAGLAKVRGLLQKQTSTAGLATIAESLASANIDGGSAVAAQSITSAVGGITDRRLAVLRGSGTGFAAAGDAVMNGRAWGQVFGSTGEQDKRSGVSGYDVDTWGGALGFDTELPTGQVVGFAFSFADTDVDSKGRSKAKTEITSYQFSVYGDYRIEDGYFVSGQLGYMLSDNETTRFVGGDATLRATGEYDANQFFVRVKGGRDFAVRDAVVTPTLMLNYSLFDADGYTEKGAQGAGVKVTQDNLTTFEIGADVAASWKVEQPDGTYFTPSVHAGVRYDATNERVEGTNQFVAGGARFKTQGAKPASTTINLGAGITYFTNTNWELSAAYDFETKSSYTSHGGYLKAAYRF